MSKFEVGDRVRHGKASYGTVVYKDLDNYRVDFDDGKGWWCHVSTLTKLRNVSLRKEKKKRPALWFSLEKGRIILHGKNNFVMYTRTIYSTSAGNQQLKRLGKESGIEVRK